jgi:C4-dicarboxylate-specific signal transduction histidine kinase
LAGFGYYEVDFGEPSCFADDRFAEICGMPSGYQKGLQRVEFWIEHIHRDDRQRVLEERQNVHEGKFERYDVEYRYLHPTQGQKWIHHLGCVATRDATGRTVCAYGVVRDLTRYRQAEQETRELRENVVHLARVNTLGVLSGSLAHELSQPLGIILGNAQAAQDLLAQEPLDVAEEQSILTDIVAAARRAGEVVVRLRGLLKRGQVSLQPVQINQVIEEVLYFTRADFIGRGVTVERELAADLPRIAGDRVQL